LFFFFFFYFVLHLLRLGCNIQFALRISPFESTTTYSWDIYKDYEDGCQESKTQVNDHGRRNAPIDTVKK
jgi:hypothetical protein